MSFANTGLRKLKNEIEKMRGVFIVNVNLKG